MHDNARFHGCVSDLAVGARAHAWALLAASGLLTGCAGPQARIDALARAHGLESLRITGRGFEHQAYVRPGGEDARHALRVYLEGDGTPWITRTRIAEDPTPRDPLALRLMALDPGPAVYLGRPCYHGLARAAGCTPWLWTDGRYSEPVVASLAAALDTLAARRGAKHLTLIGYSGGGVLAWLLAERMPAVERLVTIAANLDLAAWTSHHGYSPLGGSLDPGTRPPLPARVTRIHLMGRRDDQVPAATVSALLAARPGTARIRIEDADHRCCWTALWPDLLSGLTPTAHGERFSD